MDGSGSLRTYQVSASTTVIIGAVYYIRGSSPAYVPYTKIVAIFFLSTRALCYENQYSLYDVAGSN